MIGSPSEAFRQRNQPGRINAGTLLRITSNQNGHSRWTKLWRILTNQRSLTARSPPAFVLILCTEYECRHFLDTSLGLLQASAPQPEELHHIWDTCTCGSRIVVTETQLSHSAKGRRSHGFVVSDPFLQATNGENTLR